jgi:two-component system, OmpR family, sensor histidine kinase QseC
MVMATSFQTILPPTDERPGDERPRWSLRSRLLTLLLAMTIGLWAVSAVLFYREAIEEGAQLFDDSLSEAGSLLLRLAEHEILEHGPTLGVELMKAEVRRKPFQIQFQIWTADMQAAYRSDSAPERPFAPFDADGFGWTEVNGERWRTYVTWNAPRTLQMQIAEPLTRRKDLSWWTLVHLAAMAAVLLPVSMLLIWWILTRSLRPLQRSATSVALRSPDDLQAVPADDAPSEVTPLLAALNRLLIRMRDALQMERRFTADASHELRSPLAAIRTNAQVMSGARNREELRRAGTDLMASVDRTSRLIDQLLVLARIDAGGQQHGAFVAVDLALIAEQESRSQQSFASARQIAVQVEAQSANVRGIPNLLSVLLRNLLDNAIRYTRAGSSVTLRCGQQGGRAWLAVSDDGPGIPPELQEQVFQRFYRVLGNDAPGSGLGLSIVRRIAELHGASVELSGGADGAGATFVVTFTGEEMDPAMAAERFSRDVPDGLQTAPSRD